MRTVTIIGAFNSGTLETAWNHANAVSRLAADLGAWLLTAGFSDVGFTIAPSFGGGAGWDVEPGFTLTFAEVTSRSLPILVAEWLCQRENQQAVCILEREEAFSLYQRS
jgi:hypothetical protein